MIREIKVANEGEGVHSYVHGMFRRVALEGGGAIYLSLLKHGAQASSRLSVSRSSASVNRRRVECRDAGVVA
jgi:hypothetical protein